MSQIPAYSRNVAFLSRIPVLKTLAEYNPDFEIIPEYAQGYQPLKEIATNPPESQESKDAKEAIKVLNNAIEARNKLMNDPIVEAGLDPKTIEYSLLNRGPVLPVLIKQPIPIPNPSRQEPVATRVNVPDPWNISEHEKDVTAFRKQIGVKLMNGRLSKLSKAYLFRYFTKIKN